MSDLKSEGDNSVLVYYLRSCACKVVTVAGWGSPSLPTDVPRVSVKDFTY